MGTPVGRGHRYAVVAGALAFVLLLLVPVALPSAEAIAPAAPRPGTGSPADGTAGIGWVGISTSGAPAPPGRMAGALAYSPVAEYSVLFGGCTRHLCPTADTWKYAGGNWTNLTATLARSPSARSGAVLVFDATDGYLLLFGGAGATTTYNDTWAFVAGGWTPIPTSGPAPSPRALAQAMYDPARGAVVLFGGWSPSGHALSDTWAYAGGVWANLTATFPESPPARSAGALAYDAEDGYGVLFGGASGTGALLDDTWSLGAAGWTNLTGVSAARPAARVNSTLAFDAGRTAVILFGGAGDSTVYSDTWAFSGGRWTALSANLTASPGARYGSMSTYDGADGYLLLFGGVLGGSRYATWALLSPLAITIVGAPSVVPPGVPFTVTAEVTGGLAPYSASWQFGDGSAIVPGVVGGHTYGMAGTYVAVVTVTDAAHDTVGANTTLVVRYTPLNVTIHSSRPSATVGQSITFSAVVSGGASPYAYSWSAPAGLCAGSRGPILTCTPVSSGGLEIGVAVLDVSGLSVSTALTVPVVAAPASGSATQATPTPTSLGGPLDATGVLVPLAIAIAAGLAVVGVAARAAARRRRERARAAERPLCYAVPAWSETPPEFDPSTSRRFVNDPWSRSGDPPSRSK